MHIRQTTDAALIARLNEAVQQVHVRLHPELFTPYSYPDMKSAFEQYVRRENSFFFVVAEQAQSHPVGYIWIELRNVAPNCFRRGYQAAHIHQLSVSESEQRLGFGSALMEHAAAFARESGCTQVELDYWVENTPAAAFYRQIGYQPNRVIVHKPV